MGFSKIRLVAATTFVTIGISTFAPQTNAATLEVIKYYLAGCLDEYEALAPGAKEKAKTLTDSELQTMSDAVDELEAVNDAEMIELMTQLGTVTINSVTDKPYTAEEMAALRLNACNARMRLSKLKNGNAIPAGSPTLSNASDTLETASADASGKESAAAGNRDGFESCQRELDAQEIEFKDINARNPNTQSIVMGTSIPAVVPGMQVLLYMTQKRMDLLDLYCKGQPQYSQYESTKNSRDETMKACERSTSDNSVCKPNLPWQ
ncbi:MAG: hypothetical protein NT046_12475 [Arenimonas sp.]|nr:hypothetical protein [Arenimonas sp.]